MFKDQKKTGASVDRSQEARGKAAKSAVQNLQVLILSQEQMQKIESILPC